MISAGTFVFFHTDTSRAASSAKTALINGDSVTTVDGITQNGTAISLEQFAAQQAGYSVTVVSGSAWDAMTAAQFAQYQLLIVGDPYCSSTPASVTSDAATWVPVVMGTSGTNSAAGNRVLVGTDPEWHYLNGSGGGAPTNPSDPTTAGAEHLVQDGITYAGEVPGATGVYFDTSCSDPGSDVSVLNSLSSGGTGFTEDANPPCAGNVQIIAAVPEFGSLTDQNIQGWFCSDHITFPAYPRDWQPLAVATDTATHPTCGIDPYTNTQACGESYLLLNSTVPGFMGGSGNGLAGQVPVCNAGQPVNCATGNLWETFKELSVPGRGIPLRFSLTYNSLAAAQNGGVGFGWSSSLTMALAVNQAAGTATVSEDNGSTVLFRANGSGGWAAPASVPATLTQNADGTFTLLDQHSREQEVFASAGQLQKQLDRNGYATVFSYQNGQLASVTDPAGRNLTVTYGSNGDISAVKDPGGRSLALTYDSSGNVASITDIGGGATSFSYDSNHRMLTRTDPRGGVVTNTYDSLGRATTQVDALQRKTTWRYQANTTTITDPNGNVTREQFSGQIPVAVERGVGTSADATWTYTFDPKVLAIAAATDPNGHTATHTYDATANVLGTTDPLNRKTT